MADIKQVAERLREFFSNAENEALGRGFPTQVSAEPRRRPPPSPQEQVYEERLRKLDDDERDTLDKLIEKMRR
jgi:hypothetical protein